MSGVGESAKSLGEDDSSDSQAATPRGRTSLISIIVGERRQICIKVVMSSLVQ